MLSIETGNTGRKEKRLERKRKRDKGKGRKGRGKVVRREKLDLILRSVNCHFK
jgi:hypothetical protein